LALYVPLFGSICDQSTDEDATLIARENVTERVAGTL